MCISPFKKRNVVEVTDSLAPRRTAKLQQSGCKFGFLPAKVCLYGWEDKKGKPRKRARWPGVTRRRRVETRGKRIQKRIRA